MVMPIEQTARANAARPTQPRSGMPKVENSPVLRFAMVLTIGILCLTTILSPLSATRAEEHFLQPEQAFRISSKVANANTIVVSWDIEPGYYIYKSKFRFLALTPGFKAVPTGLPEAETKQDDFFGEVEIYRDQVQAQLAIERSADAGDVIEIEATSQGCADAGLCYPPQKQIILLELPRLAATEPTTAAPSPPKSDPEPDRTSAQDPVENLTQDPARQMLESVRSQAWAANAASSAGEVGADAEPVGLASITRSLELGLEDEILPAEEAFQFQAEVVAAETLGLTWRIAPGTYLYQEKIELALEHADGVQLGSYELPQAEVKPDMARPDGSIGEVAIYQSTIKVEIPLLRSITEATEITLMAKFQGCAERGICYPPVTERLVLALPAVPRATATDVSAKPGKLASLPTTEAMPTLFDDGRISEQDQIAARLASVGIFGALVFFFGLGLLLAFTPCVFPMIPILSGIIAGQGEHITTGKAFILSLTYVLAMALTYAVIGVIAGLFGANLQATLQNPWVLTVFAAVFVALAISMFGFYDLQLPSNLQTKLTEISNKQQGGTLVGVAIMGALSALIVGPCLAPPLMGALIFIGQTGDALLGFFALFGLGLGMGAPLLVIGTSAGNLLPRAGAWMDAVKAVFGVLLLAVAILLLERILPVSVTMLLSGLLLIASGVYLGALTSLDADASGWRKLWKSLGVALLAYGVLMLVGAAAGGKDSIQPLRGFMPVGGGVLTHTAFQRIKTVDDLDRELAAAAAAGKPVMLDFYADWCVSCKEMERYTFPEANVIAEMQRFVLLQADVTANDAADKALMQERFNLPGPPAILFFDSDGNELRGYRLVGFVPADRFAAHLQEVAR